MFISPTSIFLSVIQQNNCSDNLQKIWTSATTGLGPRAIFQGHQPNFSAGLKDEMQLVGHLFEQQNLVMFLNCGSLLQKNKTTIHKKSELILKSVVIHTAIFSAPGED